jgi:uncharacterized protein YjbI with pentapeptide repeats
MMFGHLYKKITKMKKTYIVDKKFEKIDFSKNELGSGDYENCSFLSCDFSNVDLSSLNFAECEFNDCNMSMVIVSNSAIRNVKFKNCKLLGVHFENCNKFLFEVYFENCLLNLSSF